MLEVQGLVKIYGMRRVVDGVDFRVDQGEIVGLFGAQRGGQNHQLPHDLRPDRAQCRHRQNQRRGYHAIGPCIFRAREGGMGYLAQESSVFRKLTVEKNLLGVMEMLGFDRKTRHRRCDQLLEQFDIIRLRKSLAISLSGGERRRLEIARAWFPARRSFCWTSRSRASIRLRSPAFRKSSANCAKKASPS